MKKFGRALLVLLACTLIGGPLAGCKSKQIVGKVKDMAIPDGIFINNFATEVYNAQDQGDTGIDFDLKGEDLYNDIKNTEKDGKPYFDLFVDNALEASRKFMVQYQVYSGKEEWPSEADIEELEKSAKSYLSQIFSYYGTSFGASTEEEMARIGYSMTYDDLIQYFTMTSTLQKYKSNLQEKLTVTEDELTEFYKEHESEYRSVKVRHSLLKTTDMDEDEKAEVLAKAQELVEQYNAGQITMDDIVKKSEDVDSSGKVNSDGYYTVDSTSSFVQPFKDWALQHTEKTDELGIVESDYGYHIMQCVEILDLSSDSIKESVMSDYKAKLIDEQIEEETKPYLDKKEYKLKKSTRSYAEKLAKRTFTGDFSDVGDATATATAEATATAKPEYNDAPADTTVVAKFKGNDIYKAYYVQFFAQAVNEVYADVDFSAAGDSEEEVYKIINEYASKEYKDGKTYLEYAKEYGLELLRDFLATREMATEAGKTYTEEERKEQLDTLDSQIDSMVKGYGASSRDELMQGMMNVNVNDYKNIYIDQMLTSAFGNEKISEMKPEESALKAFYEKNADDYRIVTIRHISKSLLDDSGNPLPEEKQAEILKLLETLQAKLANGDSAEALVAGYSDATDATASNGLVDLAKSTKSMDKEVIDWAFSQTQLGAVKIIKTASSYELVIIEGLTDYTSSTGTVASKTNTTAEAVVKAVTTNYKNDQFNESIKKYVQDNNLTLTDIQNDVVDQVAADYITYKKSESEK